MRGRGPGPERAVARGTRPRGLAVAFVAAVIVTVLATAAPVAALQIDPVYRSERRSEEWVTAEPGFVAFNQRPPGFGEPGKVLLRPSGEDPFRVNPTGTYASYPSLDLANPHLGDALVYAEWRGEGDMDLQIYDVTAGTFTAPPSSVNTHVTEMRPSLSGDHLFFGRGPVNEPPRLAILYDLAADTSEVIDRADYVWPGDVEGDWAVYQTCGRRCRLWRYQISTRDRNLVPPPDSGIAYFPIVDDAGVVYFGASGTRCGESVRLMRHVPGASSSVVVERFPRGIDIFPGDVVDDTVFFGRFDCAAERGDIYRLT